MLISAYEKRMGLDKIIIDKEFDIKVKDITSRLSRGSNKNIERKNKMKISELINIFKSVNMLESYQNDDLGLIIEEMGTYSQTYRFFDCVFRGKGFWLYIKKNEDNTISEDAIKEALKSNLARLLEMGFIDDMKEKGEKMKISILVERIYDVSAGLKCDPEYNEGVRVIKKTESEVAEIFKIETQNGSRCIAVKKDKGGNISRECIFQELKLCLGHLIALGFEDDLEATHNVINNPSHYTQGKIDCIDAIESATINKKGIEAVCVANIIKYLWRYENKNGIEDVKKAQWYLKRLIDALEIKERLLEKEKEVARVAEDFMRKHPTCLKCGKSCEENIKKCSSCKKNQPKEYREFLEQRLREKMNGYFIYGNQNALEEAFFYIKKLLGGD